MGIFTLSEQRVISEKRRPLKDVGTVCILKLWEAA